MTLGKARGPIRLCIPLESIEPISRKLSQGGKSSQQGGTVKMVVQLGATKLSAREIMNLAVGDVIMTEHGTEEGLDVLIEGRRLFDGLAGVLDGQKAVRIRRSVAPPDGSITEEAGRHV
jgi:flagellar motor switch protein FliM